MGVETGGRNLAHRQIKLFGCDLQHARGVALAELALAEIDGGGVVGMDRDPGIDRIRIRRTGDIAARGRRGQRNAGEAEADNERAAALEQVAAGEGVDRERGHRTSPVIRVDASWIA